MEVTSTHATDTDGTLAMHDRATVARLRAAILEFRHKPEMAKATLKSRRKTARGVAAAASTPGILVAMPGSEDAAYATVAAIALHGFRLTEVGLGDVVAVVGLGLVGQLSLQLVAAAGCVALGLDPDPARVALARELGFFATTDVAELGAEVVLGHVHAGTDGIQHAQRLLDDLDPDPVAGDYGKLHRVAVPSV